MLSIWPGPEFCHLVKELTLYETTKFRLLDQSKILSSGKGLNCLVSFRGTLIPGIPIKPR